MAPFYGWGSTASRLEPLRGGSLLFTIKFPEIPGTQKKPNTPPNKPLQHSKSADDFTDQMIGTDDFIDPLVDSQETNLEEGSSITPAAVSQWKFVRRNLLQLI